MFDDSDAPNPIFTPMKPTPETESDYDHEYSRDDDRDNDYDDGTVE